MSKDERSRGIGDTLAKIIDKTLNVEPCDSCNKRRNYLNRLFPYKKRSR